MANKMNTKELMDSIVVAMIMVMMVVISALIVSTITSSSTIFSDKTLSGSVANESGYINATGYTLGLSTLDDFAATNLVVLNATDNTTIGSGNYTLTNSVLTNATATTWDSALISYDYTYTDGSTTSGLNVTKVRDDFGTFVTSLIAFLAVIGTIVGVVWLVLYVRKLFDKKTGLQGISA